MKFNKIKAELNGRLFQQISRDPLFENVNVGGCGIVAYKLAKELCKIGLDAKIAWLGHRGDTSNNNNKEFNDLLDSNTNNDLSLYDLHEYSIRCGHCMVMVDGYFIDSNGVVTEPDSRWPHTYTITWQQLKPLANNSDGWNLRFDRDCVPQLKKTIKNIVKSLVD